MKIAMIAAALGVAMAGVAPAAAQHHVVTKHMAAHRGPGGAHTRRVCRTELRHHHRARVCRTVRSR